MAFTDWFKNLSSGRPSVFNPETLKEEIIAEMRKDVPEGIDFAELWRDPEDAGSLLQMLTIANTVILFLVLVLGFFGK